MIIVGELINSTRKAIAKAIEEKDKAYLQDLTRQQAEAGAHYIDVNGASGGDELENVKWLVELIQEVIDVPLCIDSPNPQALKVGLELCSKKPMINSISAEPERWELVLPLVEQYKSKVIILCMDDKGMPESIEDRFESLIS
ncbi:5-methyltetrahydrofolate--homocysteine methyltransferase [Desulfosporosinus sp. I2]|nr:5-methyltetrahydrofolate--homocysteine methyltransferase [Desulfosporosinus sp. I2]